MVIMGMMKKVLRAHTAWIHCKQTNEKVKTLHQSARY